MNFLIRRAKTKDATQIHGLINNYARQEQMLPRSLLSIYENIRDFYVATSHETGKVLGCSGLHFTWGDMAEVRSLAVDPNAVRAAQITDDEIIVHLRNATVSSRHLL